MSSSTFLGRAAVCALRRKAGAAANTPQPSRKKFFRVIRDHDIRSLECRPALTEVGNALHVGAALPVQELRQLRGRRQFLVTKKSFRWCSGGNSGCGSDDAASPSVPWTANLNDVESSELENSD
jgi:hypothetical protein